MDERLKDDFTTKILQLTRLVFIMNERNEENQALIDSIVESYEEEQLIIIDNFLKEINHLKAKIKKMNSTYEEKYQKFKTEIKKTYEIKFKKLQSNIDILISDKKNIYNEIKYDYDKKINSMLSEVKKIKDECEKKIIMIESKYYQEKKELTDNNNTLIEKLNLEIVKNKTFHKEKITDYQQESERLINSIREDNKLKIKFKDNEITMKNQKIKELEEEIRKLKEENNSSSSIQNNEIEKLKNENQKLKNNMNKVENHIKDLNDQNLNSTSRISFIENTLRLEKEKNINLENDINEKKNEIEKLNSLIQTKENTIKDLLISKKEIKDNLEKLEKNSENNLLKHNKELNDEKKKLQNEKDSYKRKIKEMENLHNSNIEKLKKENEEDKKKLEIKLKKNIDLEKIRIEKDSIIKNLKEKISNYDSQLKSKEDMINKLKSENDAAKRNYTKELDDLKSLNRSMSNRQNEITNLKKKLKSEKDILESRYREEIDRINFQHTLEINEVQVKLDSQISKLKIENLQLKENYEKLLSKTTNLINTDNLNEKNLTPEKDILSNDKSNEKKTHHNRISYFNNTQMKMQSLNLLNGDNDLKSNFVNYQNNMNDTNKRSTTNISSPINGPRLIKKNSKKLVPVKNINSIRLSKITINANIKK